MNTNNRSSPEVKKPLRGENEAAEITIEHTKNSSSARISPERNYLYTSKNPAFDGFVQAVKGRLSIGRLEYQDRSFDRPLGELVTEICEELEDVAGWSFVLWCRLQRIKEVAEKLGGMP